MSDEEKKRLEDLAHSAQAGDRLALETVVERIQQKVYGLALRTLWHPEDARDATQEVLVRIVTHLGSFRGESGFLTWVYRVAANHLTTVKKSRAEQQNYTFQRAGEELDEGLAEPLGTWDVDEALLREEVRLGCTLGMLLCLDRAHRLAFIVGDILELDHREAAVVLDVSPATFRKRLSRARADLIAFTRAKCGIVNPENRCRCRKRINYALEAGRVEPKNLRFASDLQSAGQFERVLAEIESLQAGQQLVALYRAQPDFRCSQDFMVLVRKLIELH